MVFFSRCSGDFVPLFQLLDDYDVHRSTYPRPNKTKARPVQTFTPKFDVYEVNNQYHLQGELPGVDQENIEIEFTDPNTLLIKGRSERNYHTEQAQPDDTLDAAETSSTKSHQPTVEDDDEDYDQMSDTTPAASPAPTSSKSKEVETPQKRPEAAYRYWISERSIGEFQRSFVFPVRVDQDSVTASLKDGILSLVLPKEAAPKLKKIRVE